MNMNERGDILSGLYKASADLGVLLVRSQSCGALSISVAVTEARDILNEKIDEMQGREAQPRQSKFALR